MKIERIISISTCHIKESTSYWLDDNPPLSVYQKEGYGWFVYINHCELDEYMPDVPKDLQTLFKYAANNECTWINLDSAVEQDDVLPVYKW